MIVADLGLHVVGLGYQRTINRYVAIQVDLESYTPWTYNQNVFGLSGDYRGDVTGVVLRARPFIYLNDKAPKGYWVSPFVQGGLGWATRDHETRLGSLWAFGATVGYSFLIRRRVHIALGLGVQYQIANIAGGTGAPSFGSFYPTADASLGYAF